MVTRTDEAFRIGNGHLRNGTPCQDYALSGMHGEVAWAAVSDGCGGAARTDVGSRLQCLGTVRGILRAAAEGRPLDADLIEAHAGAVVSGAAATLGLDARDLPATDAYAVVGSGGALLRMRGDGVLALAWRDGRVDRVRAEWAGNAPAYPAYAADGYAAYVAAQGGPDACGLTLEWTGADPRTELVATGEGVSGVALTVPAEDLPELAAVAVFTDGVGQVDGMAWHEVVDALLAFKGVEGGFAKRRLNGFLRAAERSGARAQDDLGYAVVLAGD